MRSPVRGGGLPQGARRERGRAATKPCRSAKAKRRGLFATGLGQQAVRLELALACGAHLGSQRGGDLLKPERFLNNGTGVMGGRDARAAVARREDKRAGAGGEEIGYGIDFLRTDIHVQQSRVDRV